MSTDDGRRPSHARGRKRDHARTDAILAAAAEVMLEVGIDRLRIQDVAERAGSGTGAIYRRWSTKQALVAEAIRAMPAPTPDVTDDPVADLRALVAARCREAAAKPDLVPGLIAAMRSDADIERAVVEGVHVDHWRSAIARMVGEDHPHLALLTDLLPAIPLFRSIFAPGRLDADETTEEIVSLIESLAPGGDRRT